MEKLPGKKMKHFQFQTILLQYLSLWITKLSRFSLRTNLNVGAVIISDSTVTPRREGVTAFALAVSGLDPVRDDTDKSDLFGKNLQITHEAIADQLATAANAVMGNACGCNGLFLAFWTFCI